MLSRVYDILYAVIDTVVMLRALLFTLYACRIFIKTKFKSSMYFMKAEQGHDLSMIPEDIETGLVMVARENGCQELRLEYI
jgi:hypothetical protein